MTHTFTRQELFDLVWTEPTRTIAKRLGVSDVGLAKACRKSDLLLPPRGYWAKLAHGKKVKRPELPARRPGVSDRIEVGTDRWGYREHEITLATPDPPIQHFPESLDAVEAKVRSEIGTVKATRDLENAHGRVQKLLAADELRREKQRGLSYPSWDPPLFESPLEQRRLRVLSSIMRGLDKAGVSVTVDDKEARKFIAHVGDYGVQFNLEPVKGNARTKGEGLCCRMMKLWGGTEPQETWSDTDDKRLETRLTDIAVAIVVQGERVCREVAGKWREYVIDRKKEIAEELRKKEEEARRLERERQEKLEKARVARLLAQANAFRQANEIRTYVAQIEEVEKSSPAPMGEAEFARWRSWVLVQADAIDPVLNGAYRSVTQD